MCFKLLIFIVFQLFWIINIYYLYPILTYIVNLQILIVFLIYYIYVILYIIRTKKKYILKYIKSILELKKKALHIKKDYYENFILYNILVLF